ncbi:MAG: hypothetical protein J6T35_04555, partial [Bacteroidales bacterium]|nr:hypothetical protein [Bacteroidales bacterium]
DDGKGGRVLAFMKDGAVLRNPENGLNPYTATDLVMKELKGMGVLEEGRVQTGTGSKEEPVGSGNGTVDISGAKSQVEADEIISKALLSRGLVKNSGAYMKEYDRIRAEKYDIIKALPLK